MSREIKYYIDDTEDIKAQEFIQAHYKKHSKLKTAIGGMFVWSFCNTSLGTVISIRCDGCKEEIDITDYGSW